MSIREAICDQNGEFVRENALRIVYTKLEQTHGKVTFHCPICMKFGQRTDIIACACTGFHAMRPYFKTAKHQQHHKQCCYYTDNIIGELEHNYSNQLKEIKQRDADTILDFRLPPIVSQTSLATQTNTNHSAIKVSKSNGVNSYIKRIIKETETTNRLSKLVATYKNNPDEIINFPGKGKCFVKDVFKRVDTNKYDNNEFVFISSIKKVDKYGRKGFRFIFEETIDGHTPILYLDVNDMGDCFDETDELVTESETKKYR